MMGGAAAGIDGHGTMLTAGIRAMAAIELMPVAAATAIGLGEAAHHRSQRGEHEPHRVRLRSAIAMAAAALWTTMAMRQATTMAARAAGTAAAGRIAQAQVPLRHDEWVAPTGGQRTAMTAVAVVTTTAARLALGLPAMTVGAMMVGVMMAGVMTVGVMIAATTMWTRGRIRRRHCHAVAAAVLRQVAVAAAPMTAVALERQRRRRCRQTMLMSHRSMGRTRLCAWSRRLLRLGPCRGPLQARQLCCNEARPMTWRGGWANMRASCRAIASGCEAS